MATHDGNGEINAPQIALLYRQRRSSTEWDRTLFWLQLHLLMARKKVC